MTSTTRYNRPTRLLTALSRHYSKVHNDILRTVDHGGVAVLVLLDLSAAFDTIAHSILLDRMRHQLGINGVAHAWFESYLTRRTQRIRIGDAWSLAKFLLYCVPQGSVLGPLLFLIYILPLHHLILSQGLQVHGYALCLHSSPWLTFSHLWAAG